MSRKPGVGPTGVAKTYGPLGRQDILISHLDLNTGEVSPQVVIGGSGLDAVGGAALGRDGVLYVVGVTDSVDFPTVNAHGRTHARGAADGFVLALSASGDLVHSSYIGGFGVQ